MGPRFAPWPIIFIMSAIWRCIFRSRLTSSTLVPEPAAMRFLREAFEEIGVAALLRRHRRDDGALALEELVVDVGGGDLVLHLADAGQHAHDAAHAAELLHLVELLAQVVQVELALAHLLGDACAFSCR